MGWGMADYEISDCDDLRQIESDCETVLPVSSSLLLLGIKVLFIPAPYAIHAGETMSSCCLLLPVLHCLRVFDDNSLDLRLSTSIQLCYELVCSYQLIPAVEPSMVTL
jgi:hypothetical protein